MTVQPVILAAFIETGVIYSFVLYLLSAAPWPLCLQLFAGVLSGN